MEQMEKSVNNAFSDIQTKDRFKKSLTVYETVHRQVAALIQWFDQASVSLHHASILTWKKFKVLNDTVLPDLEDGNSEVSRIQQELRVERLNLIREKVKEHLGHDIEIDYEDSKYSTIWQK